MIPFRIACWGAWIEFKVSLGVFALGTFDAHDVMPLQELRLDSVLFHHAI